MGKSGAATFFIEAIRPFESYLMAKWMVDFPLISWRPLSISDVRVEEGVRYGWPGRPGTDARQLEEGSRSWVRRGYVISIVTAIYGIIGKGK